MSSSFWLEAGWLIFVEKSILFSDVFQDSNILLSKPRLQPLPLEGAFFFQVLSGCLCENNVRLGCRQKMTFHHHRLACADFQITASFTLEHCFRLPPGKCSRDAFRNRFTHPFRKHAGLRERLAVCHCNLHHIANGVYTWELSLQRTCVHRDPARLAD